MATHSSTFAWKIPGTEEPGRLQSMGSRRVGHDWVTSILLFTFTFHFHALEKEMSTHSSIIAWRIPGTGAPGGLPSMGSHRVGHDWSDLAGAAAQGSTRAGSVSKLTHVEVGRRSTSTLTHVLFAGLRRLVFIFIYMGLPPGLPY